jgi:hypothetical protein
MAKIREGFRTYNAARSRRTRLFTSARDLRYTDITAAAAQGISSEVGVTDLAPFVVSSTFSSVLGDSFVGKTQ